MGGFAQGFNETNDQTRKDLTKAELIAFPILALLLLFVFRGVVAAGDPAADRRRLDRRHALRPAGHVELRRHLGLRAQHRHRAQPRPRGRLRAADGLALPRGDRRATARRARRTGARSQTAGRTALFSGLTVAAAMAALVFMPQRFLYSMAVAGASVAVLSSLIARPRRPRRCWRCSGTRIDALSIRRGPAVSDDSDGWYRLARGVMRRPLAVALASGGLLLAAAAPLLWTTLTGPSAEAVPPRPALLRRLQLPRSALPARRHRGGHGRPSTAAPADAQLAAFHRRIEAVGGVVRGTPFVARRRQASPTPTSPSPSRRSRAPPRTPCGEIRDLAPPGAASALVSGNTARFIDQKQSLLEHAPLVVAIIALDHPRRPLPAHRLGAAAAEDAADELADARRHPRHPRPRLPGRLARRPARLHRPGGDRGDQPRLPLRRDLRPRHRLRGAGDGADQGAARPRRLPTRRRSRSASAAPAA